MKLRQILGASIPRSGHHFLVRILRTCFDRDLFYCEPYQTACCQQFPCTKAGRSPFAFKKSHDLELSDDPNRNCIYIVQYRDPVFCTLSHADLRRKHDDNFGRTREEIEAYLSERANYYIQFMKKWYRPKRKNYILIDYDRLTDDPVDTIDRLLTDLNYRKERTEIARTVEEIRPMQTRNIAYTERSLEGSQFYDKELFDLYESIILDRLKYLEINRKLAKVDNFRESPMFFGYVGYRRLHEGDLLGASQAFMRAYKVGGSKLFYTAAFTRLGDHHWKQEHLADARKHYQNAMKHGLHQSYVQKRADSARDQRISEEL